MSASESRKSVNTAADAQKQNLRADEHVTELSLRDSKRLAKALTAPKVSQKAKTLAKKYRERAGK